MSYVEKAAQYVDGLRRVLSVAERDEIADFARWLDREAAQEAMGAKPAPRAHACPMPVREGDEYVCRGCPLRWGTDEEKPPCLHP